MVWIITFWDRVVNIDLKILEEHLKPFMRFDMTNWLKNNKKRCETVHCLFFSRKNPERCNITLTRSMGSLKAFFLHRIIREEANEQLVAAGCDGRRLLSSTETTQFLRFSIAPVVNVNVVIGTLQVGLHVDLIEGLLEMKRKINSNDKA